MSPRTLAVGLGVRLNLQEYFAIKDVASLVDAVSRAGATP